jgi:hypothetical protein
MANEERFQRIGRMRTAVQAQDHAALAAEADHVLLTPHGPGLGRTRAGHVVDMDGPGGIPSEAAQEDKKLRRILGFARAGQWEYAQSFFHELYGAEPDPREASS